MKIKILIDETEYEQSFTGHSIIIGRASSCDFRIKNEALSRSHCIVEFDNGCFYITDLNSSNGVFINGHKLVPHLKTEYNTFLSLALGPFECHIHDPNRTFTGIKIPPTELKKLKLRPPVHTLPPKAVRRGWAHRLYLYRYPVLVSAIILSAVFIGGMVNKPTEVLNAIAPVLSPAKPKDFNGVKQDQTKEIESKENNFSSKEIYETLYTKKTCQDYEFVCANLDLQEKRGEGVVFLEKSSEIFVYVQPEKFEGKSSLHSLKAIKTLLESNIYLELLKERSKHIHLVLLDPSDKPLQVYRSYFPQYGEKFKRDFALHRLDNAIQSENPSVFWQEHRSYFPYLEL